MTQPFPLVERALRELLQSKVTAADKVGSNLGYDVSDGVYVYLALVPGGRTDRTSGEWIVDIDVFAPSYGKSMEISLAIEALLVGRAHRTELMILDSTTQNEAPAERPWDDERAHRTGATYVFTARRSG